jgi:hypothetical protein
MNPFVILAAAEETVVENDIQIIPIDRIWQQIESLSWFHAIVAISFGVVYLLYGWRIFKVLAVICFSMIGLFAGIYLGDKIGNPMWGGILGVAILGFISIPMMKWAICILGAIAGGTVTGAIWYALELNQTFLWAGAATGVVFGGMISFIVFKIAVMLFTSLGGSATMMAGVLALLHQYQKIQSPDAETTQIQEMVYNHQWFLAVVLIVPAIIGVYTQNRLIKESDKWEL